VTIGILHHKGEVKKALDVAEQGLEKGQGALGTLYEYVFRHYDQIGENRKALQLLKRYF
jgi:ribulose kinase